LDARFHGYAATREAAMAAFKRFLGAAGKRGD
jgi:hypothetical protein